MSGFLIPRSGLEQAQVTVPLRFGKRRSKVIPVWPWARSFPETCKTFSIATQTSAMTVLNPKISSSTRTN